MKYALAVYIDPSAWTDYPEEHPAIRPDSMPRWMALFEEMARVDPDVAGFELERPSEAKVVRIRDGERIVTDGPFAETKELVGGVFVIELPDLDEAIRIASLVPAAEYGSMEICPVAR